MNEQRGFVTVMNSITGSDRGLGEVWKWHKVQRRLQREFPRELSSALERNFAVTVDHGVLEKLILGEIEGTNRTIHAYDGMVWKTR